MSTWKPRTLLMPAEIAGDPTGGIDFSGLLARLRGSLLASRSAC
jgi:hypothetical protein